MSKTKDIIVEKALEMYNTYGIEYVGVRELAKELNMKGGNITYYFPTKNDLIVEIQNRLSASNSALFDKEKETSIFSFLQTHYEIYSNQYNYRAIFISLPLLMKQGSISVEQYKIQQLKRRNDIYQEMKSLFLKGYFQTAKADDMDAILESIIIHNRFWISEATADGIIEDKEFAVSTYIHRIAALLKIIASEKGKMEIGQFLQEIK